MRRFLARYPMQPESLKRSAQGVTMEVYITDKQFAKLAIDGLTVERRFDATAHGRERQKQVGQGNRFDDAKTLFYGLGALIADSKP